MTLIKSKELKRDAEKNCKNEGCKYRAESRGFD